jgi:hypothetical protein
MVTKRLALAWERSGSDIWGGISGIAISAIDHEFYYAA